MSEEDNRTSDEKLYDHVASRLGSKGVITVYDVIDLIKDMHEPKHKIDLADVSRELYSSIVSPHVDDVFLDDMVDSLLENEKLIIILR